MSQHPCDLCRRITKTGTTEHHLIPRTCHKNKWFKKRFTRKEMAVTVSLCKDCHSAIHDLIPSEKELGRNYYTVELLKAHPQMAKFLDWVRKQK
ncbi:MAG: hypothetical protein KDB14_17990 [Planctomycetales bacterium]|nr:hypothetical protein [Planctomycetales bacterium]